MLNSRFKNIAALIFWLVIILIKLIRTFPFYSGEELSEQLFVLTLTSSLDLITFLFFYYFVIPKVLMNKKIKGYILYGFIYWLLFGLVWSFTYEVLDMAKGFENNLAVYKASFGHTLLSTLYAIVLGLSVDWFVKYQNQKELEKQNIATELAMLKSQINPHFLFNTLNNIHSYSLTEPEKSSYAIIKLSEIMRYMLYDTNVNKVLIQKEIKYIEDLIELHKLRFKQKDFIKFNISGKDINVEIPPLIFLPFIENAFKHGKLSEEDSIIINLHIQKEMVLFECINKIKQKTHTESKQQGGIGIKNIRRRLDLLFQDNYHLSIEENEQIYYVKLELHKNED